jgi:hypothetical protein
MQKGPDEIQPMDSRNGRYTNRLEPREMRLLLALLHISNDQFISESGLSVLPKAKQQEWSSSAIKSIASVCSHSWTSVYRIQRS